MSVSPITILAQTTELNESDSNLNELNVSNSYTVEQVVRNFEFENDGYAVFLKETMELLEYSADGILGAVKYGAQFLGEE